MTMHDFNGRYTLDAQGEPVPCPDLMEWARSMENARQRVVAVDIVSCDDIPDIRVSTVFLGLDHGFDDGPPVLWETMVFGGPLDMHQARYRSRTEALAGHLAVVDLVRQAIGPPH